jgi:hypothetical protein
MNMINKVTWYVHRKNRVVEHEVKMGSDMNKNSMKIFLKSGRKRE